ncbi:hypothetical protein YC2023_059842 [Brassica napus]
MPKIELYLTIVIVIAGFVWSLMYFVILAYERRLPNGREKALKKLSQASKQGENEFVNEAKLLAKFQHWNVSKLSCIIRLSNKLSEHIHIIYDAMEKYVAVVVKFWVIGETTQVISRVQGMKSRTTFYFSDLFDKEDFFIEKTTFRSLLVNA